MSLYTKLDDTAIRQIAQQFDIGTIQSWKMLHGGVENTNHLICTDSKKYVLTLCERKTVEETNILANILESLEQQRFLTSKIIKNKKGASISIYQGKPILLKTYIEGKVKDSFDEVLVKKLGKRIAQLNQLSPPSAIPYQFSYGQQFFHEVYENVQHPFANWLKETHTYILENLHPALPKAFIHGDIFTSNVVIKEGEPVIMDFEEACYYYRLFDLGMATIGTCLVNGQIDWEKVRQLIEGYKAIIELTDLEIKHYKFFIIYAATATAFWRFRQFNILVPIEERKDSYKELQNLAMELRATNITF